MIFGETILCEQGCAGGDSAITTGEQLNTSYQVLFKEELELGWQERRRPLVTQIGEIFPCAHFADAAKVRCMEFIFHIYLSPATPAQVG